MRTTRVSPSVTAVTDARVPPGRGEAAPDPEFKPLEGSGEQKPPPVLSQEEIVDVLEYIKTWWGPEERRLQWQVSQRNPG